MATLLTVNKVMFTQTKLDLTSNLTNTNKISLNQPVQLNSILRIRHNHFLSKVKVPTR